MFCQSLEDCSHFVWNPHENDACILKKGNVLKVNAIYLVDYVKRKKHGIICGIINDNCDVVCKYITKTGFISKANSKWISDNIWYFMSSIGIMSILSAWVQKKLTKLFS